MPSNVFWMVTLYTFVSSTNQMIWYRRHASGFMHKASGFVFFVTVGHRYSEFSVCLGIGLNGAELVGVCGFRNLVREEIAVVL